MIQYTSESRDTWSVWLDRKQAGTIRKVAGGYQYFPKGKSKGGKIFSTVGECKRSLES